MKKTLPPAWFRAGLVLTAFLTLSPTVSAQFAGGTGSPGDPYQVATAEQLDAVRNHLGAHFIQTGPIDLGVAPWTELGGWVPIGTPAAPFSGWYDGDGFAIENLTILRTAAGSQYQGLFGSLNGAIVRNLSLTGAQVAAYLYSGILAGNAVNSWIESVSTSGSVSSVTSYVGGVVGHMNGGLMHRTHSIVSVWGKTDAGGLVGAMAGNSEMRHCSAHGGVSGETQIGGLVGQTSSSSTLVSDCHSRASASGDSRVGGLIGYLWTGRVYRSYSSGAVSGPEGVATIGGLTGQGANVRDCFWDIDASGQIGSAGGEGLSTAEMGNPAAFRNFNFHTLWEIDTVAGYPVFQDFAAYEPPATVALESLAGSGTPEDPYILTDADELNAMRLDLTASYRLGNDIDLRDVVLWDMGRGWTPVGTSATGQRFVGRLDGAGFTISHLAINRPLTGNQGLIGYAHTGAVIEHLQLSGANVQASMTSGLLAGATVSSRFECVSVEGLVVSGSYSVGALIGTSNSDHVHRAHADAVVQGLTDVGGLVGSMGNPSELRHCSARGAVSGVNQVGGLVGQMATGSPLVSDCYSRASASGDSRVGGLIGYLWTGAVYRSYSSGAVSGPEGVATIGGLTGQGGNVRDCFWDVDASGRVGSAGGEGLTTAEMADPASFRHYNFHTLWEMEAGGYPVFQDFVGYAPPAPVELASLAGSGTPEDPYLVTTASELHAVRLDLTADYRLGNDIDLRDTVLWDMGRGWTPVGVSASGQRFAGTLDGANFRISHLVVNRPLATYQGLFGYLDAAAVENLRIEHGNLQCATISGMIAGQALNHRIERVSVQGVISSGGNQIGGMVGVLSGGSMNHAHGNTIVRGGNQVGGLAGYLANSGEISQSSARGSVTGNNDVGGLVGQMTSGSQIVVDSYSRAVVTGDTRVGGLVGNLSAGSVARSYSTGLVHAVSWTSTQLGGLTGFGGTVQTSYWNSQTSTRTASAGGEGRTSGEMTHPHASNTFVLWDFTDIWSTDTDGTLNGGYPYLRVSGQNPQSGGPFTLAYHAGYGGTIEGPSLQTVAAGESASTISALADDGAVFIQWSDGSTSSLRTDADVLADLAVLATFRSIGGVPIDWYASHGIFPSTGQSWDVLDDTDWLGKGMTLREEFLAGTDPNDPLSRFAAEITLPPSGPIEVQFDPSLPDRIYTLWRSNDLIHWIQVPGQIGIAGGNSPLIDPTPAPGRGFYRIEVGLP